MGRVLGCRVGPKSPPKEGFKKSKKKKGEKSLVKGPRHIKRIEKRDKRRHPRKRNLDKKPGGSIRERWGPARGDLLGRG